MGARALLDSAERGKRQTEAELAEARGAVNEMTSVNSRAAADKRRVEELCTPFKLRLTTCFTRLRTLRRRPKRLWLMLLVLLMSLDLSKTMSLLSPSLRGLLRPRWQKWKIIWLMQMKVPCVVARTLWPSSSPVSGSWRLNLETFRLTLEKI